MRKHTPLKVPQCHESGKTRYADEATARAAAIWKIENGQSNVACLCFYRCEHCLGWHFTRNKQSDMDRYSAQMLVAPQYGIKARQV